MMYACKKMLMGLMCLFGLGIAHATPITNEAIPSTLQDWQQWVLYDKPEHACPFLYNVQDQRHCAWPTQLNMDIEANRIYFTQQWQVFAETLLQLPGDRTLWPQHVTVNGSYFPVIDDGDKAWVELPKGQYNIKGFLPYGDTLPQSIQIPAHTALVQLSQYQVNTKHPRLDDEGRLWLHHQENNTAAASLQIHVFREITQSIPMEVLTLIELDVSGPAREIELGPVLVPETQAMRLDSSLPVQLDERGLLRVQVRPGKWQIEINSRFLNQVDTLKRAEVGPPWPAEEIWSFNFDPRLGNMSVSGVPSVDPTQTLMPEAWRNYPAYRVLVADPVVLMQQHQANAQHNQLNLTRHMWLDFSGQLWTVEDQLQGEMLSDWRLSLHKPFMLGRATLGDKEQLITGLEDTQGHLIPGVELRQGYLSMTAMSLVPHFWRLPVTGWSESFNNVSTTLSLPPGWHMFTAFGVDTIKGTWLAQWSLFDVFIVILIAIALASVLGARWGIASCVMLLLTYHQMGAPVLIWFNIVLVLWLVQWCKQSKGCVLLMLYRDISFVVLGLLIIWLSTTALMASLYPQIQLQTPHLWTADYVQKTLGHEPAAEPEHALMEAQPMNRKLAAAPLTVDPFAVPIDAKTQTGPSKPQWEWTQVELNWNTPVAENESVYMLLISPLVQRILMILQIVLSVWIGLRLWQMRAQALKLHLPYMRSALIIPLCILLGASLPKAHASDIPDATLLETLQERLLVPEACLPNCASISQAAVSVNGDELHLILQVDAAADVAVPIPGRSAYWQARSILIDNMPAEALAWQDNTLMVQLNKGMRTIAVQGSLADIDKLSLEFLLPPHWINVEAQGWFAEGVDNHQLMGNTLHLSRRERSLAQGPSNFSPFVRVIRTLNLGLTGEMSTRIERVAPNTGVIQLAIPLLPHESVTSNNVRVQNNRAQVYLSPDEREMTWESNLSNFNDLTLLAPQTTEWVEEWRVQVSPIWHPTITGIPALYQSSYSTWESVWQPWPLQSVHIQLIRPVAMPGQTVTIDQVNLLTNAHNRGREVSVQALLRSTLGQSHTLTVPEGVELTGVRVNGVAQVLAMDNPSIMLPLGPGNNWVDVTWKTTENIGVLTRTPNLDWGMPAYNINLGLNIPDDRFVIALGGTGYGPALLYWLWIVAAVILAVVLSKTQFAPLSLLQWLILTIGLSIVTPLLGLWVVIAIVLIAMREKLMRYQPRLQLVIQLGLCVLIAAGVLVLFYAILQGLRGEQQLQWASSALNSNISAQFVWLQDLSMKTWPRAFVISLPLWVYRGLMLLWSLWLILLLMRLIPWAWRTMTYNKLSKP